eukprot:403339166
MMQQKSESQNRLDELLKKAEQYTRLIFLKQAKKPAKNQANKKDEGKSSKRKHDHRKSQDIDDMQNEESQGGESIRFTDQPSMLKGGKLMPHQIDSLNWMITLYDLGLNGILADDMGLGKTIQAISMMVYLYQYKKVQGPHLIITPKSTISNWMKEFEKWAPFLKVVNLIPTMEHRKEILKEQMQPGTFNVCVTTYEGVNICSGALQKYDWHYQVYDEAHKLKNIDAKISLTSRKLSCRNRILMTGTPLQNNLRELFGILNYLMPEIFGSEDDFNDWFCIEDPSVGQKMTIDSIQKLHKILRPFLLRRVKKDLEVKLPDKIEINVKINMTKMQLELYEQLLKTTSIFNNKNTTVKTYFNLLMQLRKACNHPYLFDGIEPEGAEEYGEHIVDNCGKMRFLDKLLKKISSQKEQVLIFSQFTSVLDIIEDYCLMRGFQFCRLDGTTDLEERERMITEFTAPNSELFIFLLSTKAGGLGLNLMSANHVVIYDSDWNPQVDLQAMDRAYRIGQKKDVFIYRLITKPSIEEKIIERQAIKLKLDQVIIQQGKTASISSNLSKDEYEKILLAGAALILQQKQQAFQEEEIDIDKLIEEGVQVARQLKENAEKQADQISNSFDFSYNRTDLLQFQDVDYRAEKGKFQEIWKLEQQKKIFDAQKHLTDTEGLYNRQRRYAAMQKYQDQPAMYNLDNQKKGTRDPDYVLPPKKQKLTMLAAVYDFQFYQEYDLIKEQIAYLKEKINQRELVTDEELNSLKELLSTGFHNWTIKEYQKFVKAIRKFDMLDIKSIAEYIETKTEEEVQEYMNVFLLRFKELKEKDVVLSKIYNMNLEQKILETIRDFDINKNYVMLLQENNYYNRNLYLATIEKEHNKMVNPGKKEKPQDLQLKIDHFFHSQTSKMVQEQLRYIALAVRAEDTLRGHLSHQNERKRMRAMIERSKQFSQGYQEGISAKEKDLVKNDAAKEIKQESHQVKRVGPIDENLKYGRRKKTANLFKNTQ